VANIAEQAAHGEDGLELRSGERHFLPGANWVLPAQRGSVPCTAANMLYLTAGAAAPT